MTDNRTTELREKLTERGIEWTPRDSGFRKITYWKRDDGKPVYYADATLGILCMTCTPEQAIAATLGSDDRYDAGFASGVQAVFQQLEGIEDYEELQCFIAEYWGEGEGNDER